MRIATLVLIAGLAAAQTPAFDVASVKVSQLGKAGGKFAAAENIDPTPSGLNMTNVSLFSAIEWAYAVKPYQISGPAWLESERFDIAAKAAGAVPAGDLRRMLQALLAERFKLALHHDEKELPVYALVVGKGGAKLEASKAGSPPVFKVSGGNLVFSGCTLAELADRLSKGSFALDRPILDQTGLTGTYDFSLKFADSIEDLKRTLGRGPLDPATYNDSLTALGLKLDPRKGPLQILVIDHAEKLPVEN